MLLYIHIPFCDSKCGYCAFNSLTNMIHYKKEYLEAIKADLIHSLNLVTSLNNGLLKKLDSIYIGGGTPNTLAPKDYEDIFNILQKYISKDTEINIELNPNASKFEVLWEFKNLGINRFSIGIQSFREDKLKLLDRIHSVESAKEFIQKAIKCDIYTSIDLIYDTRLDSKDSIKEELNLASSLGIGHISCYTLSIDENSRFYTKNKNPTLDSSLCYELKERLELLGFNQYEVSNYAKTHKSKHNLGYWQYKDYIGIGLGAVGKINNKRFYKQDNFQSYLKNPFQYKIEILSKNDIILEKIFLGVRSEVGVNPSIIKNKNKLEILVENKKCILKNNRIYNTNYFLADEIALWLEN
ncbi:radical SAM family heme chaperone HemW [Helicobacter sp. MIT 14-3879]|uniref:radical SAM family heme chaperone HemW n=1 Tax=Helicobacter sp. MIT 14-3879 TaxID=2040649 RepID=UPI000E1E8EA4|nr:radical SAM family heme chaperone HemW [Helicobacter sp. MIT 14-3879]RDU64844.1 coproporphyrinogen III oxidase family protein [Helicobacter sp. MIT 14-3879]